MVPVRHSLLALTLAALVAGCGEAPSAAMPAAGNAVAKAAEPAVPPPPVPVTVNAAGLPDFSGLVEAYGRAVVNVATIGRIQTGRRDVPGIAPDDPLHDFFERFGFGQGPRGRMPPARGEGSGFIVSPDGYILTNAHVVANAEEVTVRMTDRREYSAKVIGVDERTDVAVLKIDGDDLPYVRMGDPEAVKVGEWVVAIGSPFGFENSVTAGIVSAKSRSLPGDAYTPFIQTDVAINPGNSGGALVNMSGELIGINSMIFSRSGGNIGIGLAVPTEIASSIMGQIIDFGEIRRGLLGVNIQDIDAEAAKTLNIETEGGALISRVFPDSAAEKAGLEVGDVIAVEPGLYREDLRAGIRLEQNYRITDDGCERLSGFPLDL